MLPEYIELLEVPIIIGEPCLWTTERIIELIKVGKLPAYARMKYNPPDYSLGYPRDEDKNETVRIKSITGIPGSDSLFCEYESVDSTEEVGEEFIALKDIRLKTIDVECLISGNNTAAIHGGKTTLLETDIELCERLKREGWTEKAIAQELNRVFPKILPSRIGRLLPANPGSNISSDGHRKRGTRLLE